MKKIQQEKYIFLDGYKKGFARNPFLHETF